MVLQIRRIARITLSIRSIPNVQIPVRRTVRTQANRIAQVRNARNIQSTRNIRIAPRREIRTGHSRATRLLVGIFVLACAPRVGAQTPTAQQHFEQGRSAFERQDYSGALEAFEAALAAHMEGPAIHFNIGVAAYRSGAYDRARLAFEQVAQTPAMAALAHYNLGLVALAQNDEQRAIDAFVRVYADSDERLRALARARLDAIGTPPSAPSPRGVAWAVYASTGVGYDDNVTLTSRGQAFGVSREGDAYGDTLIAASMQLTDAWRVDVDASWLNYLELSEFDQWGVGAGARYRFVPAPWTLDVGAQLGTTYLDGERFDLRESLYVQAARTIADTYFVRTRYRVANVDGSDDYPGLGGLTHELTARLTRQWPSWTTSVIYTVELSDYDSDALSAVRHRLSADLRVPLSQAWAARATLGYRHSDYDEGRIGSERRIDLSAAAELRLSERWLAALQYVFTDSDAEASEYSYRRNRVFLGVEASF